MSSYLDALPKPPRVRAGRAAITFGLAVLFLLTLVAYTDWTYKRPVAFVAAVATVTVALLLVLSWRGLYGRSRKLVDAERAMLRGQYDACVTAVREAFAEGVRDEGRLTAYLLLARCAWLEGDLTALHALLERAQGERPPSFEARGATWAQVLGQLDAMRALDAAVEGRAADARALMREPLPPVSQPIAHTLRYVAEALCHRVEGDAAGLARFVESRKAFRRNALTRRELRLVRALLEGEAPHDGDDLDARVDRWIATMLAVTAPRGAAVPA